MRAKDACLIINPRTGENLAKLTDILTVLAAAGWDTDILIKKYGGNTLQLAKDAARQKYDLVIAYGGDGTLNQVVNGVLYAQNGHNGHSSVAVLPGGTANVWANEVGIPADPVKSALTLINSRARQVDIGHVQVEGLTFPPTAGEVTSETPVVFDHGGKPAKKHSGNTSSKARHDFLLMAGLGIDAAIMGHVSKPLKYRIGPLAVGVSAAKELPKQHPFPVQIHAPGSGGQNEQVWRGEAIQVVIGNTRKYADVVEMTPEAYIDDGSLDVCVITANDPLTTMQQITSLLLRRKPDNVNAEYFHGPHLYVTVPATVALQVDGSAVKLKDYLSKKDRAALGEAADPGQVMVTYRFDALPKALSVAVPCTYDNALFESAQKQSTDQANGARQPDSQENQKADQQAEDQQEHEQRDQEDQEDQRGDHQDATPEPLPLQEGLQATYKVKVIGASRNPDKKKPFYVIAGTLIKQSTGEIRPVAVRVNGKTTLLHRSGGAATLADIDALPEGAEIGVDGKKNKKGVIAATNMVI